MLKRLTAAVLMLILIGAAADLVRFDPAEPPALLARGSAGDDADSSGIDHGDGDGGDDADGDADDAEGGDDGVEAIKTV